MNNGAINRRHFLGGLLGAGVSSGSSSNRTNVVMIMTDDQGVWSLGCYGNANAHTPNIDRLAATGVRFSNALVATAVCSPSRMTFMTGRMPFQHGVQTHIGPESTGPDARRFLDGYETYASILAGHGYALGYCGKWHMGDDATPQQGFQHWFTTLGDSYRRVSVYRGKTVGHRPGYPTDVITDDALKFIEENRSRPFFIQVSFHAPHTPYDYQPERYRRPYLESSFPEFPEEGIHPNQIAVYREHLGHRESKLSYMALVTGVDHNVGRIVQKLQDLNLRGRTLIVFCSDQGFNGGHHGVWGKGNGTLPFNMYEQTIRIPLIYSHPGRIKAGAVLDAMVSNYDFLPTITEYVGIREVSSGAVGRSYASMLDGSPVPWPERAFAEFCYVRMIRTKRFKYVARAEGYPSELYDLGTDPGETRNLVDDPEHVRRRNRLRGELREWFERRGAPPIEKWRMTVKNRLPRDHNL